MKNPESSSNYAIVKKINQRRYRRRVYDMVVMITVWIWFMMQFRNYICVPHLGVSDLSRGSY